MEKTKEFYLVYLTTDNYDSAQHIARIIVTEKLAACCTIVPNLISIYGWKGAIQESHEYQLIFKTKKSVLEDLEKRILELHSYEVPEIIAVPVDSVNKDYLKWFKDVLEEIA